MPTGSNFFIISAILQPFLHSCRIYQEGMERREHGSSNTILLLLLFIYCFSLNVFLSQCVFFSQWLSPFQFAPLFISCIFFCFWNMDSLWRLSLYLSTCLFLPPSNLHSSFLYLFHHSGHCTALVTAV
ncbi:unnamed protein product [Boreogadus saida]